MSTCVSLKCPFILYCKHYNFLIDRGDVCKIQLEIIEKAEEAKRLLKEREAQ